MESNMPVAPCKTPSRLISVCHVLAIGLILSGCGGGAGSGPSADGSPAAAAPPVAPPPTPGPPDTSAPTVPTGLNGNAASPTQVTLAWNASTDNVAVTGYRVFRNGNAVGTASTRSYTDSGLSASTSYRYAVSAYDASGNASARTSEISVTTPSVQTNVFYGTPSNYLGLLRNLRAGDTLILEPGNYDDTNDVPGLPIFGLNGEPGRPITIAGTDGQSRPVLLGRATHNTIRFDNASYIVIRNLEIDGRDLGGDGINAQGVTHHITLEDLVIRGVGQNQQVVGISTNPAPAWNWVIRRCQITGAGTGMYLGNYDGTNPFVAGLIEHNVIRDTLGYNIQIKQQTTRAAVAGMPTNRNSTIVRHNVFSKSANSSTGGNARPNLLIGHLPPAGPGADDVYEIYGNFFYQNPSGEVLLQGEGNIAFYHNLLVNSTGSAIRIMPHYDVPKMIRIFHNTIVANGTGVSITGASSAYQQRVIGNAVFAPTPIQAADQVSNITDSYQNAGNYLQNPTGALGTLDLYPRAGTLRGVAIDSTSFNTFTAWDSDFNQTPLSGMYRGAYSGEGTNPGWTPRLEIKP